MKISQLFNQVILQRSTHEDTSQHPMKIDLEFIDYCDDNFQKEINSYDIRKILHILNDPSLLVGREITHNGKNKMQNIIRGWSKTEEQALYMRMRWGV